MLPASLAIIAGVDVLAITVVTYVAYSNPAHAKQHNTAFRVCVTFALLGAMCGHGHGMPWFCAVVAFHAVLGLIVWWASVCRIQISS
jgi:hypothetical protein